MLLPSAPKGGEDREGAKTVVEGVTTGAQEEDVDEGNTKRNLQLQRQSRSDVLVRARDLALGAKDQLRQEKERAIKERDQAVQEKEEVRASAEANRVEANHIKLILGESELRAEEHQSAATKALKRVAKVKVALKESRARKLRSSSVLWKTSKSLWPLIRDFPLIYSHVTIGLSYTME
ncbi:hypothetical protein NE237_005678 [Protea cynaroides]|uniref:Uncharacterized protein n=1 Tax=Protea cynaroides TaxID=273540 RepID=A0A9Q0KLM7_9MAGN|nr:hypothetical protein NE237_005678 [Protea cynaroides]